MKKLVLLIVCLFMCAGCSSSGDNQTERFEMILEEDNYNLLLEIIVDDETGIEYLIVRQSKGIGVTPLYNADGSVKIHERGNGDA